jgi:hypothetical protein
MFTRFVASVILIVAGLLLHSDQAVAQQPVASLTAPSPIEYGDPIPLNGSASQAASGRSLTTWQWTRVSGPAGGSMALNQPVTTQTSVYTVQSPASNPVRPGTHRFQLVVTDDAGFTSPAAVVDVLVRDSRAPVAVLAGPTSVVQTAPVALNGSGSYDHAPGTLVRWIWTRVSGAGGSLEPGQSAETGQGAFTVQATPPFEPGVHRFRLVVVDESGNQSAPAEHALTVQVVDMTPPTAVLTAPAQVEYGDAVTLSGAGSSDAAPGSVVRWTWTRLSGTGGGMAVNQPIETDVPTWVVDSPAANPLAPGLHRFRLVVADAAGNLSQPATAQVTVRDTRAPTAVLVAPASTTPDRPIVLDGRRSSDVAPGRVVRWIFTRLSGTGGEMPLNQPMETESPTLTVAPTREAPLASGTHRFRLVVVDAAGNVSVPAEVTVEVR